MRILFTKGWGGLSRETFVEIMELHSSDHSILQRDLASPSAFIFSIGYPTEEEARSNFALYRLRGDAVALAE